MDNSGVAAPARMPVKLKNQKPLKTIKTKKPKFFLKKNIGFYQPWQQPVARRADFVKQFAFEFSNRDSTKVAARFLDRRWKSLKSVS
jgi:hypothetical protein